MNEWAVCEVKQLYDRFGNNYEVTLIDRAMKANQQWKTVRLVFFVLLKAKPVFLVFFVLPWSPKSYLRF